MAYSLVLNGLNRLPRFDGDRTLYRSPHKRRWAPGSRHRSVIYVNGMNTTAEAHEWTAHALSEVSDTDTVGIYNLQGLPEHQAFETVMHGILHDPAVPDFVKTALRGLNRGSMFLHDVAQCVRDYFSPLAQKLMRMAHLGWGERARFHVMKHMVKYNPAMQSLLEVLDTETRKQGAVRIVCHSQGNLIVVGAIEALKWIRDGYCGRIHVYALASPACNWESTVVVRKYTNLQDPITWLSLGQSQNGAHIEVADTALNPLTWLRAHGVDLYVYQKQFVDDIRRDFGV